MSRLRSLLRNRPLLWIVPVLVFLALVAIAWMIARTPDSPYIYRI